MKEEFDKFKELLENNIKKYDNVMECPFGMNPYKEGVVHRKAIQETLVWVLEMMPEFKE